jgi:hypothetical protein
MRRTRPLRICISAFAVLLAAQGLHGQDAPLAAGESQRMLDAARTLFTSGAYEECRTQVSRFLEVFEAGGSEYPYNVAAAMYSLDAFLAYTFREEGFEARIDRQLRKGLELDLNLSLGDPAEVPPFVLTRFEKVRTAYLQQFLRVTRRNGIGLFGALILEPTVLQNPLLIQPGIAYIYNLTENLSVAADFRFPLQWPLWNSIRGQVGLVWYPTFSIEKIATGIAVSYTFGLDNLDSFTHSISFAGRAEYLTRMGFGIVANAELVRADLIVGGTEATTSPSYSEIPFLGLLHIVFANVTVYLYYAF